jgi:hypothetical protein
MVSIRTANLILTLFPYLHKLYNFVEKMQSHEIILQLQYMLSNQSIWYCPCIPMSTK